MRPNRVVSQTLPDVSQPITRSKLLLLSVEGSATVPHAKLICLSYSGGNDGPMLGSVLL